MHYYTEQPARQLLERGSCYFLYGFQGLDRVLDNGIVETYEDFEDPRGKYVCLLYVLSEPLSPEASIEAGDDASHVQWHAVENLQNIPDLAYNHIRLLREALRQLFTSYYHNALGMQEIDACQCEVEMFTGQHCSNTGYWRYNGVAICPRHIQSVVRKQERELVF